MFVLKKVISAFLLPIPMIFLLLIAGFTIQKKWPKLAFVCKSSAVILLLFFSYGPTSDMLIKGLEDKYPVYQNQPAKFISVLGSGHNSEARFSAQEQLSNPGRARLLEGIRIYKQLSGSKMIFSGFGGSDPMAHSQIMKQAAISLGVNEQDIITFSEPKDTHQEALVIKGFVADQPLILVTSASHLPRATALFEKQGVKVIPAPADFTIKQIRQTGFSNYKFEAENILKSERAIHEYLGILYSKLTGRI